MKKTMLIIAVIAFSIIAFTLFNIEIVDEIVDLDSFDNLIVSTYNHVYLGVNQGVYGTILGNSSYGFLNNYGLQSKYIQPLDDGSADDIGFSEEDKYYQILQYRIGVKLDENAEEAVYKSKVNLGGTFFSLLDVVIDSTLRLDQFKKMFLYHFISSTSAILLFLFICYWCYKEFGLLSSVFVMISLIGSKYLLPYGSSLSNSAFVYYLVFTVSLLILYYEEKNDKKIKWLWEFFIVLTAVMIKFMMGYELFPTVMVSATVMYFYYAITRKWDIKYFLKRFLRITAAAISGLVITLSAHFLQLSLYFKSASKGLEYLMLSFGKRLWGSADNFSEAYAPSLKASAFDVIDKYFRYSKREGVIFGMNLKELLIITLVVFVFIATFYLLYKNKNKMNKNRKVIFDNLFAIAVSITISLFGAFSTLIVLKAHSHIHFVYSVIAFHLPFTLLLFAMIGYVIEQAIIESI